MTEKKEQRRGLGRGLSALLSDLEEAPAGTTSDQPGAAGGTPTHVSIDLVAPNPSQPRRRFDEDDLVDLAASIRERGIIQPLIVRPDPAGAGRYQIVAGERRWRAAQAARLHEVPVVVRDFDDQTVLEVAIIENVQRSDLNPLEEAQGYAHLIERFSYTQDGLSRVVGKSRSHLANMLRLLSLPDEVRGLLEDGTLSAGHARALLGAADPVGLAREAVEKGFSVRQVERAAKTPKKPAPASRRKAAPEKDADTRMLEGDLSAAIGMSVRIAHAGPDGNGEVRIQYRTLEDLDRLCQRLAE